MFQQQVECVREAGLRALKASLWAIFLVAVAWLVAGSAWASERAILNPNQIRGEVRFINTSPAILDLLMDEGLVSSSIARVRADSAEPGREMHSTTSPEVVQPTAAAYEVTVEAGDPGRGIPYLVSASLQLDGNTNTYVFSGALSDRVEEEPAPDVELDLEECAGVLDVGWRTADDEPQAVASGSLRAWRESVSESGQFNDLQASGVLDHRQQLREHLVVRGDGAAYRLDVRYTLEFGGHMVTLECRETVRVACDEIVEVHCEVPTIERLGRIVGQVDIVGEEEVRTTSVRAIGGPFDNSRRVFLSTPHWKDAFALEALLPSDMVDPERSFGVETQIALRRDDRYQFFVPPVIGLGQNPGISIEPSQTFDLGETLVIDPGYVHGEIVLAGVPDAGKRSCLADLHRASDNDSDGDGLPVSSVLEGSSYVGALGRDLLASGASSTAVGGLTRTLFAGAFNGATGRFEGDYDLILGGLGNDETFWTQSDLALRFLDESRGDVTFQDSRLLIQNRVDAANPILVRSGESVDRSIEYCFSDVRIRYSASSGRFFHPSVQAVGRFTAENFLGDADDYLVHLSKSTVRGTPLDEASAADSGMLNLCLPQGSYQMRPFVTSVNPGGGTSETELPPVELAVGCGQTLDISTDLQMALDPLPACATSSPVLLTGRVNGTHSIERVDAAINRTATLFCRNCGENPTFEVPVEPTACENRVFVRVRDTNGNQAVVADQLYFDDTAPGLIGCADVQVDVDAEASGARVDFSVGARDNCDGGLSATCDHAPGFFNVGTTTVTCSATDRCGHESTCTFDVRVRSCRPGTIYGVHDEGLADSQLFRLDLESGTAEAIGPLRPELNLEALELDAKTGELYTVAARTGELFRVDKASGDLTLIGVIPNVRKHREISSLAFHPDGTLWAYHKNIGLVTVSLDDASAVRQWYHSNSSPLNRKWDALAWDPSGDSLWGIAQRELFRFDPQTRQVEVICGRGFFPGKTEALDFSNIGEMVAGWHEPDDLTLNTFVVDPEACTISQSAFDIPWSDIEALAFEACE